MSLSVETGAASDGMEEQLGGKQRAAPNHLPPSKSEVPPAGKHRTYCAGTHSTHHDGHTGEQHSREKLPDPGGGSKRTVIATFTLTPTVNPDPRRRRASSVAQTARVV